MDLNKKFTKINLPSRGFFYRDGKKSLLIKYLTGIEEEVLCDGQLNEDGTAIKIVLENLIMDDIRIEDLTMGDFQAILLFLRSTAYGDNLDLKITCPHCEKENTISVALSRMEWNNPKMKPEKDGYFHLELPLSKNIVRLKPYLFGDELNRLKEECEGIELEENFFVFNDGFQDIKIRKDSTIKLNNIIKSINDCEDKEIIKKYVKTFSRKDSDFIKSFIKDNELGVKEEMEYECDFCTEKTKTMLSFGYNFLNLPIEYKNNLLEEIFLMTYYGKTITYEAAYSMPVYQRRFYLNRISSEIKKRNDAERSEMNKAKSGGKK